MKYMKLALLMALVQLARRLGYAEGLGASVRAIDAALGNEEVIA